MALKQEIRIPTKTFGRISTKTKEALKEYKSNSNLKYCFD